MERDLHLIFIAKIAHIGKELFDVLGIRSSMRLESRQRLPLLLLECSLRIEYRECWITNQRRRELSCKHLPFVFLQVLEFWELFYYQSEGVSLFAAHRRDGLLLEISQAEQKMSCKINREN